MINLIYALQIVALLFCVFMAFKIRRIINGLSRGLILLFVLLILRRLNDVFNFLDDYGVVVLSSAVVLVVTYDLYQIYKDREIYLFYFTNREKRRKELDAMSNQDVLNELWNR